jgi:hypothetical protein
MSQGLSIRRALIRDGSTMTRVVLFLIAFAVLAGCKTAPAPTRGEQKEQDAGMIVERVVVDDDVINKGDPDAVIDPVWWTADIYEDEQKYNESLARFSLGQRRLFAVVWHVAEVNNGGHTQFYSNSTRIVWKDALEGYRAIGLDDAAAILELSAKRMGGNPSLDRMLRQEQLDSLEPDFEDLDDRFFKLQETVDFNKAMMAYIGAHRGEFYFEGNVERPKLPSRK